MRGFENTAVQLRSLIKSVLGNNVWDPLNIKTVTHYNLQQRARNIIPEAITDNRKHELIFLSVSDEMFPLL
jgi:hypothetical protein